jgi:hypothetical protein
MPPEGWREEELRIVEGESSLDGSKGWKGQKGSKGFQHL